MKKKPSPTPEQCASADAGTAPSPPPAPVDVTPDDHDAGFKVHRVTYRSGRVDDIKFLAPRYRDLGGITEALTRGDYEPLVSACLESHEKGVWKRHLLNRVTLESANEVQFLCYALAFGWEAQKKMARAMAGSLAGQTVTPAEGPSSPASEPATPPEKSAAGASPS